MFFATLAVPVADLVTTPDGRPAVAVGTGKHRRLVAVTVGLFDDATGLTQIRTPSLRAGQRISLPSDSSAR